MIGRLALAAAAALPAVAAAAPAAAATRIAGVIADLYAPALLLIGACCYLVGLCLVAAAGFRLLRRAHDRFGPSLASAALMALAGSALIHLPSWLEAFGLTLFGPGRPSRLTPGAAMPPAPGIAVLLDVLMALLFLIGLIAAARGVALLPAAADGRATPLQALCHLLGGLALCNFPALAGAVDAALGLALFRP